MSHSSHSQLSDLSGISDLVTLAASLQATAQALLCHCEQSDPPDLADMPKSETDSTDLSAKLAFTHFQDGGETRSYHFSPSVVRSERELLKKYQVKDFRGLITETHVLLVGIVKIMKSVHSDTRMRGHVISSLGCLLEQVSTLTLRMHNVYTKIELLPPQQKQA